MNGVREAGPRGPLDYLIVLFSSNEKACEIKYEGKKEKYNVYFKYVTKYVYLSRIHIINSGTRLYFYLYLYVAGPFTNGNFGNTGG
jgi:hypothetical protein